MFIYTFIDKRALKIRKKRGSKTENHAFLIIIKTFRTEIVYSSILAILLRLIAGISPHSYRYSPADPHGCGWWRPQSLLGIIHFLPCLFQFIFVLKIFCQILLEKQHNIRGTLMRPSYIIPYGPLFLLMKSPSPFLIASQHYLKHFLKYERIFLQLVHVSAMCLLNLR